MGGIKIMESGITIGMDLCKKIGNLLIMLVTILIHQALC